MAIEMPQTRARQAKDIWQPVDLRACRRSGYDAADRAPHVEIDRKRNEINGSHSLAKGMEVRLSRSRKTGAVGENRPIARPLQNCTRDFFSNFSEGMT